MKVVNTHVIIDDHNTVYRFEELEDGRFIYLHRKLAPSVISKEEFADLVEKNESPKISSLT